MLFLVLGICAQPISCCFYVLVHRILTGLPRMPTAGSLMLKQPTITHQALHLAEAKKALAATGRYVKRLKTLLLMF
jgi:hypothetical protein